MYIFVNLVHLHTVLAQQGGWFHLQAAAEQQGEQVIKSQRMVFCTMDSHFKTPEKSSKSKVLKRDGPWLVACE